MSNIERPTTPAATTGPGSISSLSTQLAAAAPPASDVDAQPATASAATSKFTDPSSSGGRSNAKYVPANASGSSADIQPGAPGIPFTPRRLSFPNRLSLQMPSRGPLSPILDPALGYSVARRPRLDFARSCTSLHHSTLAAESSPDSSPLATSSGYPIPRGNYRPLDSPISNNHNYPPGSSHASSLGSASMLDYASGDDSDSSTDEDVDLDFDLMDTLTPSNNTPAPTAMESAASISLLDHQKARFGARHPPRRSSIGSRTKPMMSPSPIIQPISQSPKMSNGFDYPMLRRNSLTLGPSALEYEVDRPDPIRRPVSRRGSLLPKTKNFQRIKAALIEESSPIDLEVKREAEITRQIREEEPHLSPQPPAPSQGGETRTMESELANIGEEDGGTESGDSVSNGIGISFSKQAERHGGFWFGDQMEGISGSPPTFPGSRMGSDGDIIMNSDSCVNSPITAAAIPPDMRRPPKRRRTQDERFEPNVFKRRAVSPGLSNSPKLAQSPPNNGAGKRLNFQGFSDTHDGLMKMTLQ
ncbi:hypothetical protein BDD12DRAFT_749949 [Trichophaea hybrida]|nr:hypothetical protein BDD12DRAFT_749949 [Trichophaea hybrida]